MSALGRRSARGRSVAGRCASVALASAATAFALTTLEADALAQTAADHELALAEFKEGRRLMVAGDCAGAVPRLERSLSYEPSVGARLAIVECIAGAEPLRAWRLLADAALLAYTNHDDRLPETEARSIELEKVLPTLHLGVAPSDLARPGLEVRLDGVPLDRFHLRRGVVAVAPGEHVVEATAPDRGRFSAKVAAPVPGAFVQVPVEIPAPPPAAPAPREAEAPRAGDAARGGPASARRSVGLSLGAFGIAGLGLGTVFGILAIERGSELDEACGGDRARCSRLPSEVASIKESGTTMATVSTVSFIAGGAALAGGAVLYFWPSRGGDSTRGSSRGAREATPLLRVRPLSTTGLALEGAF